jgi:hypothetical protein
VKRAAKVDANQPRIVELLERHGCTVQSIATVGNGVPDLLIGFRGQTMVAEVKDGTKPKSAQKLTPDEQDWKRKWKGQYAILRNEDDVLDLVIHAQRVANLEKGLVR